MTNTEYVYRVLHLIAKYDYCDISHWNSEGDNIRFWVNCGDTFAYACADGETIEDDDLDALQQAFEDIAATGEISYDAYDLFVARKRNQRPIKPVMDAMKEKVRALFEELPE